MPRVSVSRSIFALHLRAYNNRDRAYFGARTQERDSIGFTEEDTKSTFGRGYAVEPDILVERKRQTNGIFFLRGVSDEVGAWSRSNQHPCIGGTGVGRKQISWRQTMKRAGGLTREAFCQQARDIPLKDAVPVRNTISP